MMVKVNYAYYTVKICNLPYKQLETHKVKKSFNLFPERCGPVIGGGTGPEAEPPQPLVTREPSVSLMRWDRPTATTGHERRRTEPVSLATLERDCFVIPAHALDRFLPDGVPVSWLNKTILSIVHRNVFTSKLSTT